jgi:hypothetical protein
MTVKTIQVTATWEGILPILCTLIKKGGESERTATAELLRLCRAVDAQAAKPAAPSPNDPAVCVSYGEIRQQVERTDLTFHQGYTAEQRAKAERLLTSALADLIVANLDRLTSNALFDSLD